MLIYNHKQEFIGIDEKDLKQLGFKNLAELQNECTDFADLFVKKPNYIHNFKNFNWIYYILHSDIHEAKVIINVKKKNFSASLELETIYLSDAPDQPAYAITLSKLRALDGAVVSQEVEEIPVPKFEMPDEIIEETVDEGLPNLEDEQPVELSEPDVFETPVQGKVIEDPYDFDFSAPLDLEDIYMPPEETKSLEPLNEEAYEGQEFEPMDELESSIDIYGHNEVEEAPVEKKPSEKPMLGDYTVSAADKQYIDNLQVSKDYVYNPQVASDELGLPVDLIEEFIGDFIQQSYDFKDELYNHIADHDFDGVKLLSHKLKGVAANLRIEDAFEVLSVINSSDNMQEVKANLDHFYKIIAKLEGKEVPDASPAESPAIETNTVHEESFIEPSMEDFKEDIELKSDLMEEQEELEEYIEPMPEHSKDTFEEKIDLKDNGVFHEQDFNEPANIDEDDIYNIGIKYHDDEPITLENHDFLDNEDMKEEVTEPLALDEYSFEEKLDLPEDEENETVETFDFNDLQPVSSEEENSTDEGHFTYEEPASFEDNSLNDLDSETLHEEISEQGDTLDYNKTATVNELGLDEDLVNQLLTEFKEQGNDIVQNLDTAIANNDFATLRNLAISIKGASDNLRLTKISKVLEELASVSDEEQARELSVSFKNYINQI